MNLRKSLLSLFIVLSAVINGHSQTLTGGVLGPNNEKMKRAKVYFKKSGEMVKTNRKGEFEIEYSNLANDTLVAEAKGYKRVEIRADKFTPGNAAILYCTEKVPRKSWIRRLFSRNDNEP